MPKLARAAAGRRMVQLVAGYIYLLIEREFIILQQPVYKVGRTAKKVDHRVKQYPKGSLLLYSGYVMDTKNAETMVLHALRQIFLNRKDIGREYFEGDKESIWAEVVRVLADQIIEVPDHVETTTGWAYSVAVAVAPRIEPRPYFPTDDFLKAVQLMKELRGLSTTGRFTFGDNLLISEAEFNELNKKLDNQEGDTLTELETQQHWTWRCAVELWGLPSIRSVDKHFFDKFIGQANAHDKAFAQYFQALRHRDLIAFGSLSKHADNFQKKMDNIRLQKPRCIEMYKTKTNENFVMLTTGHTLIDKLGISLEDVGAGKEIKLAGDKIHKAMKDHLRLMSAEEYGSLMSAFDKKKNFGDKKKVLKSSYSLTCLAKRILDLAFGIALNPSGTQNHKESSEKTMTSCYKELKAYCPGFMAA